MLFMATVLAAASPTAVVAASAQSPEIRIAADNPVPACVSADRLMRFLKTRNENLDPKFADTARWYKTHGTAWRVRWDYAFFQMIVETNFLTFKRGNGDSGDVRPHQNNFAGIGTTGGGVPGDAYPDVKTGVLAHIQHLVAYSGEKLAQPVAPRTQLKQDDIVEVSLRLRRPVRFGDLARRWAVDRHYGESIAAIADRYREGFCTGQQATEDVVPPKPEPAARRTTLAAVQPTHLGAPPTPAQASAAVAAQAVPAPKPSKPSAVRTLWRADSGKPIPTAGTAKPLQQTAPPASEPPQAAALPPAAVPASQPAPAPEAQAAPLKSAAPVTAATPVTPAPAAPGCSVAAASYGGKKTLLIRYQKSGATLYTALSVLDGFERSMTEVFLRDHAPGGVNIGEFASRQEALAKAHLLCPGNEAAAPTAAPVTPKT
jgi:hypothetical protein